MMSHMNKTCVKGNNDKNKHVKTVASACRGLIVVYLALCGWQRAKYINNSICVAYMPLQYPVVSNIEWHTHMFWLTLNGPLMGLM